jgi:uncharacterized membrane protein
MTAAKNFFTAEEQKRILAAIEGAEDRTSGEIRLHLENFCSGNEVQVASRIFTSLGMHKTAERNGVLIYIATVSRKIAIVGDKGIHEKLGSVYWEKMVEGVINEFKAQHHADGLIACIKDLGEKLANYFPVKGDDTDELTNEISFN